MNDEFYFRKTETHRNGEETLQEHRNAKNKYSPNVIYFIFRGVKMIILSSDERWKRKLSSRPATGVAATPSGAARIYLYTRAHV